MNASFMGFNNHCCGKTEKNLDAKVAQEEIGKLYDSKAFIYDVWGKLTESRARERAISLAEIKDGQTILEVAVGTGLAFQEIVKSNPNGQNIGIDLSPGMLAKAKEKLAGLKQDSYELKMGSAFQLELPDNSVDLLLNNYMFDLIPFADMNQILGEFKRVLKADGKLVMVNMTKGENMASRLYELIYRISPRTMGGCRGVQLSDRLRQNGLNVKSREYYQQMLFPSEVILAAANSE